ncbi:hypothetical protein [Pseudonocardia sp. EC080610-09]|uniref:hypothetical protein n=1 Tax=Pseudonocardia sp. EC080610-09 TaxID=1688404 RepID=UPI000760DF25|nr:hypothetical protein [Pseudonocardia sp. EC080610-09]
MRTPDRHVIDGRAVLTRTALCQQLGIGQSTAERLWRERGHNGHPPVVHREGRRQWWDEQAMTAFVETAGHSAPDQINHEGRVLRTRTDLARRAGVSPTHLQDLYTLRATSGHPERVLRRGRRDYFDSAEFDTWWTSYQEAQRAGLTPVDHSGDPDELVDLAEAARVLGYRDAVTLRSYLSRNKGYFPEADDTDENGRRLYHRRTLWQFGDGRTRPGRAGRSHTTS